MTTIDPRKVQLAEKDIEDWLYENPESLGVTKWVGRQVHVPSGIIDLLGLYVIPDTALRIPVVVEVKNVELSPAAILQVCRYARDIQRIITVAHPEESGIYSDVQIIKKLVFKGGVTGELQYAANALDVYLHSFEIELDLNISGYWHFSRERYLEDSALVTRLSNSEPFTNFQVFRVE